MESQASKNVRALPKCCAPVGDGANRPTTINQGLHVLALESMEQLLDGAESFVESEIVFVAQ